MLGFLTHANRIHICVIFNSLLIVFAVASVPQMPVFADLPAFSWWVSGQCAVLAWLVLPVCWRLGLWLHGFCYYHKDSIKEINMRITKSQHLILRILFIMLWLAGEISHSINISSQFVWQRWFSTWIQDAHSVTCPRSVFHPYVF